jgi:hypothetical protein
VRQELVALPLRQARAGTQLRLAAVGDEISDALGFGQAFIGSADTEHVRPNDNGDRLAMARDRDFFAGTDALKHLRQSRSRLADSHGGRHVETVHACTTLYKPSDASSDHTSVDKTTIYLPKELKSAIKRVARQRGVSEAEVIRDSIRDAVRAERPRPRGGLFASGAPIAREADEHLPGFGER